MIISLTNNHVSKKLCEGDLIALTKNDRFIGYGEIMTRLSDAVLIKLDTSASRTFNEVFGEDLPHDFRIDA